MLEQARINNFDLFKDEGSQLDDHQLVAKYALFLSSLLESEYEWFYKDLVKFKQLDSLLIIEENLETMVGYFRTACVKNSI